MANPSTFIKIDRNILRWKWYSDRNTLALFLHFLLKANFAESNFCGKKIRRGQFVFSRRKLAEELCMGEMEIRTAINHLVETGEISVKTFPRYTVVTVLNYDKYQTKPPEKPKQKPKAKKVKESEGVNKVPEIYREMFGTDYESYKKWRDQ